MTDQMHSALYGINKFMFFSWNYAMTEIERNGKKVCLPKFIVEAKWSCNLDHIIGKWNSCTTDSKGNERDSYAFLPRFIFPNETPESLEQTAKSMFPQLF